MTDLAGIKSEAEFEQRLKTLLAEPRNRKPATRAWVLNFLAKGYSGEVARAIADAIVVGMEPFAKRASELEARIAALEAKGKKRR